MSDAAILGVVAMVCVVGLVLGVVALAFGRRFVGRASRDGFEMTAGGKDADPKPE